MKTGALTTFLALCLPVTVFATTLRLSNEVDLLVLDGKKVVQLFITRRREHRTGKRAASTRFPGGKNHPPAR